MPFCFARNFRLMLVLLSIVLSFQQSAFSSSNSRHNEARSVSNNDFMANPVSNEYKKASIGKSLFNFRDLFDFIPGTQSSELSWLNYETPLRASFYQNAKTEAEKHFAAQTEFEKIKTFLFEGLIREEKNEHEVKISDSQTLTVNNQNFKRTWEHTVDGVTSEIINTDYWAPKKASFVGLYPSPSKKYVAALINLDGSIDNSVLLVYDIISKKIVITEETDASLEPIQWMPNDQVIFNHAHSNKNGQLLIIQNPKTLTKRTVFNTGILQLGPWVGTTDYANGDVVLYNKESQEQLYYESLESDNFEVESEKFFYLKGGKTASQAGKILRLKKQNFSKLEEFAPAKSGFHLKSIQFEMDQFIVGTYSRESQETIVIYNTDGTIVGTTQLPDTFSFLGLKNNDQLKIIELEITSQFTTTKLAWDIGKSQPNYTEAIKNSLKSDNFEVITRIEYFRSHDGEFIPARITYLKDTVPDGQNPVYMEVYGGFFLSGYLDFKLNRMKKEFLKKGGILVGAGVRGGNERGFDWYLAGSGKNEMNSSLDIIAIANGLVLQGYTQAKKISVTGTSNGGYVVANAALSSPESFGLVIPINGVQDQLAFPFMDRWGTGWQREYLNPYEAADLKIIFPRAPLESISHASQKPFFLIVNGEEDSRVNKAHSYKLKARLDQIWPGQSILFSVEHAGHWANSTYLLDDIGAAASARIWAEVFKHSGLQF